MSDPAKLGAADLASALATLSNWQHDTATASITRGFKFADFRQAFAFMTQMALWSEGQGHHPDWHNVFDTVEVSLTTHDCGGLSQRDIEWARQADRVWQQFRGQATLHHAHGPGTAR